MSDSPNGSASTWDVPIGDRWTRDEQRARYGGGPQGGIVPSNTSRNIFIYSDIAAGKEFGYTFDDWDGELFKYTGAGGTGPQRMAGGNKSILNHVEDGRALRVFIADGTVPGTGTKVHQYLGEFVVDPAQPFEIEQGADSEGKIRDVIVFHLLPVGESLVRPEDLTLSATSGHLVQLSNLEAVFVESYLSSRPAEVAVLRREGSLVRRYASWLETHEGAANLVRHRIRLPDGGVLYTDAWLPEKRELIEAKLSASRPTIRQALGQLLDYERYLDPKPEQLSLLVAEKPTDDLADLLHTYGVDVIWEHESGAFTRSSSTRKHLPSA